LVDLVEPLLDKKPDHLASRNALMLGRLVETSHVVCEKTDAREGRFTASRIDGLLCHV
jgi:hypothetical protein